MARKISDEELNINVKVAADDARAQMDSISKANAQMTSENKKLLAQKRALAKAGNKQSQEYKDLTAKIDQNKTAMQANKEEHKKLAKGIDLTQKSMKELKKEANILQRQLDQEIKGTAEYQRLQKELGATKQRMYEMRKENFEVQKAMGSTDDSTSMLADTFGDLFDAIQSGNPAQIQAALMAIQTGISGMTKSAMAFIATPLGAALAIIVALGIAVQRWVSYNNELLEYKSIVEGITGVEGALNTQMVNRARTLQKVYGTDFKEAITTADTLVQKFGGSHEDAFDVIEAGLLKGGRLNDEYFDSLKEYAVFFAEAGFSAEEFKNIINKGYDLKMYSDKLPDAIKEGMLSLQEQTPATREALINAYGAPFTDDLLSRVDNGTTKYSDALKELASQSQKSQLTVQQEAQLTTDVFRGAGEDAGGYAKVMEAVNAANNQAAESFTTLENQLNALSTSTRILEEEKSKALESTSYQAFANELELTWNQIQIGFYRALSGITDGYYWLTEEAEKFVTGTIAVIKEMPKVIRRQFMNIAGYFDNLMAIFGSASDVIKSAMSFDFDEMKSNFQKFKQNSVDLFTEVKDNGVDAAAQISQAYNNATEEVEKKYDAIKEAAAEELKQAKILAEAQKLTLGGIDAEISKLKALQSQTSTRKEYLELQKQIDALENKKKAITGGGKDEGKLTKEDKAKLESRKRLQEMLDAFDEEQRIKNATKNLEDLEADKLREEMELENKYAKLEEQYATETDLLKRLEEQKRLELLGINEKYDALAIEQNAAYYKKLKDFDDASKNALIQSEINLNQAKSNAYQAGLGLLKGFVDENSGLYKILFLAQQAFAIADVITKTSAANAAIVAGTTAAVSQAMAISPLTFGQPWAGAAIAAGAKNKLANNINAGIQIATIAGQTLSGFEDGYYPWSQTVTRDDGKKYGVTYGGKTSTGVVSRPTMYSDYIAGEGNRKELIVDSRTFSRLDPSVISHIKMASYGIKGYQEGFTGPAAAQIPTTQETNVSNDQMLDTMNMLVSTVMKLEQRLSKPITAVAAIGYQEASDIDKLNKQTRNSRNKATP